MKKSIVHWYTNRHGTDQRTDEFNSTMDTGCGVACIRDDGRDLWIPVQRIAHIEVIETREESPVRSVTTAREHVEYEEIG